MKREKLLVLESLRGIAALSVAVYHFRIGSHFNNVFTNNAWLMVDFFFVLSGFVIALNYIGRISNFDSLISFQKKRFFRLYPLHFVVLMAFISLELLKYTLEIYSGVSINNDAFSEPNDLHAILANLFLVHNWTLQDLTFNTPSWSISAEFFTYALFGLLLVLNQNNRPSLIVFLSLSAIIFGSLLHLNGMGTDNVSGPLRCLYSFSIGAITFFIYDKIRDEFRFKSSLIPTTLLLGAICLITFYGYEEFELLVLFPLLFSLVILGLTITDQKAFIIKYLSAKWLVFLGTISYGIYMIHVLVWTVFALVFKRFSGIETAVLADGTSITALNNIFIADIVHLTGIILIIVCAYVSYHCIEMRFNKANSYSKKHVMKLQK